MNKASADLSRALRHLLDQMDASIRKSGYAEDPIRMFLAGGMAINYYCGIRYTQDVDAFYSRRLHPSEYMVDYKKSDGKPAFLYLDNNYNPTFGLLHDDYEKEAVEWTGIDNEKRLIRLFVLSPVDLAVTKISRFSEQDREDILSLASASLFTADQLRDRANQALVNYVGDLSTARSSIDLICKEIASAQSSRS